MSTENILEERGNKYGDYRTLSKMLKDFKDVMKKSNNYGTLEPEIETSIEMIFMKICRILNGDQYHIDNFEDIAGYSQLAVDKLKERERILNKEFNPSEVNKTPMGEPTHIPKKWRLVEVEEGMSQDLFEKMYSQNPKPSMNYQFQADKAEAEGFAACASCSCGIRC